MKRNMVPIVLVLVLALGFALPAGATSSTIDLRINPVGSFSTSTGMATVRGAVICETEGGFGTADVSVTQKVGRNVIEDYATTIVVCDGTWQPWTAAVLGNVVDKRGDGLYHGGPARVTIYVFAGDDDALARQAVKLRATR